MKLHVESSLELPMVTILAGFRGGTVSDPPGKEGLTRIAVRMLRRGTTTLTAWAFSRRRSKKSHDFILAGVWHQM